MAYLAITVGGSLDEALDSVWRERTLRLVLRSVGLAGAVTAGSLALALPLAWLTARTDLPARRAWTVLTLLPLVIPSYIGAYLVVSALGPRGLVRDALAGPLGVDRLPSIYGFPGALLALVLFTYPLALLTIRAAMRRLDPQLEEAARGMGRSGWQVYRSVVLPQLVPAIGASALLVALYVLHDFGAVSILRFDSFTRVIYTAYGTGSRTAAAALASLLVIVMLVVLWLEGRTRRRLAYHRSAPGSSRPAATVSLGRWRWPALAFCSTIVMLALVLPVAVLVYWSLQSVAGSPDWGAIGAGAGNSLIAAGMAAGVAALCALPVALLSVRFPGRASALVERASYAGTRCRG